MITIMGFAVGVAIGAAYEKSIFRWKEKISQAIQAAKEALK